MSKDLSRLTDQELLAMAGRKPAHDFSQVSDQDLLAMYTPQEAPTPEQTLLSKVGEGALQIGPGLGELARPALRAAKSIAVGTLGAAGDIAQEAVNLPGFLVNKATQFITGDENANPVPALGGVNTVSPGISQAFDKATGGLTKSRNRGEELLEIGQEIAGGIAGPGAIKTLAQKGANIAGLIGKRALQFGTGVTKKSEELVKAFTDSGVNPTLANITESKGTQTFQNLIANFPGGKGVIEKATQGQIDDITKQLAGITQSKGGTIQQTGKVIQEGAEATGRATEQELDKLYDDLDKFIPKETINTQKYNGFKEISDLKNPTNARQESALQKLISKKQSTPAKELNPQPFTAKQFRGEGSNVGRSRFGEGIYSTPNKAEAARFGNVKEIDVSLNKPYYIDSEVEAAFNKPSPQKIKDLGYDGVVVLNDKGGVSEVVDFAIKTPSSSKIPTNNLKALTQDAQIQDVVAVGSGDTAKVLARYNDIVDEAGNISYPRLKTFRSTVGAKMQSPSLLGEERGALKKVYGALSEDMKAAVTAQGGERGLRAFNKANNNFMRSTERLEKQINPLIKADTPEKVYNLALSGTKQGGSNIKPIMKGLNPTQQEFVRGTVVNRMGSANPGQQDAFGEVFSSDKFLTEWNRLSPEARSNIFSKEQVGSIENLNKVISSIKQAGKVRQSSNNLPYLAYLGLGSALATSPAAAVGAVSGANLTAKMMTNPRFLKWLAQAPKVKPTEIPKHLKVLSTISAAGNSELREDILNYLESITIQQEN
jgi:hypothetical protein